MCESLTDSEIVDRLDIIDPMSEEFLRVLNEASVRRLDEVYSRLIGMMGVDNPYVYDVAELYTAFWGQAVGAESFAKLVLGYDTRLLASLLRLSMKTRPDADIQVMSMIDTLENELVFSDLVRCLAEVEPSNAVHSAAFFVRIADDSRLAPATRQRVFERLEMMTSASSVRDFFVRFLVNEDGKYPELTEIAHRALSPQS